MSKGFITMSKSVFNDLDQFDSNKKKILGVHPLYDNFGDAISKESAIEKLSLDMNYKYMLFFGIIRKYKGLDLLLKAFGDHRLQNQNLYSFFAPSAILAQVCLRILASPFSKYCHTLCKCSFGL